MSTRKQVAANRENARRSTGPKSPEGKAIVSRNAVKHGLLARDLSLPIEDQKQCEALFDAFADDLQPAGAAEEFLVHQMASAQHRLQRFTRIETGLFDSAFDDRWRREGDDLDEDATPEEQYQFQTRILGKAFTWENFWKVARYENQIRRSFYKAIEELHRLRRDPLTRPAVEQSGVGPRPAPPQPDAPIGFVSSPPPPEPQAPQPEQTKESAPVARLNHRAEFAYVSSPQSRPAEIGFDNPVYRQESGRNNR